MNINSTLVAWTGHFWLYGHYSLEYASLIFNQETSLNFTTFLCGDTPHFTINTTSIAVTGGCRHVKERCIKGFVFFAIHYVLP